MGISLIYSQRIKKIVAVEFSRLLLDDITRYSSLLVVLTTGVDTSLPKLVGNRGWPVLVVA